MNTGAFSEGLARVALACSLAFACTTQQHAQNEGWTRPFPGHRVIGNLYAVGTYDLGVFLHDKYQPGQAYSPDTFVDPEGFLAEVERLERLYKQQLAEERR